MSTTDAMHEWHDRRLKLLRDAEHRKLRETYGEKLVKALALSTADEISLSDFHIDIAPPFSIDWPKRLQDASGLVAAYISKNRAKEIAARMEARMCGLAGLIGFHDKDYLGLCRISQVNMAGMIEACETANDSVVFYPTLTGGAVLFDCYESRIGEAFSALVQGHSLIDRLSDCLD
jgi:hypothetical protein